MLDHAIIIPARWESSRFPGKPLAKINNKEMILHVWERCVEASDKSLVYVATDDQKIKDVCERNNANVILINDRCRTGTDRSYFAAKQIKAQYIVIVQGDEPLVSPSNIKKALDYKSKNSQLVVNFMSSMTEREFTSGNVPKVIVDKNNFLLYMSRAGVPTCKNLKFYANVAKKQVCIYGMPIALLEKFANSAPSELELLEDIEILRFININAKIQMIESSEFSLAVDLPSDIALVEEYLNKL